MKKYTLIIVTLGFCLSIASSASAASVEEEVLQVITNFSKACSSADFELMSSLFLHSPKISVFGPNINAGAFLSQGWEDQEEKWKGRLGMPKGTFVSTNHNPLVTILTDDVAVITCYMNLSVNMPPSKVPVISHIRSTFVLQKIGGKWLIIHNHASKLPRE